MNNNNNYRYVSEETEIDLLDLCMELLRHWKSIILCALLFMVIGIAFAMLKGSSADSAADAGASETESAAALTDAEIEADYELLQQQYEDDIKFYNMKPDIIEEYSTAVDMLGEEIDRLKTIDESDEDARMQCLIKISSLQSAVNNAQSMRSYYTSLEKPEEPQSFEDYKSEVLKEESESESTGSRALAKYAILGLLAGGFLSCFGWCLVYMFDGKIKLASDVERYGVNILGSVDNMGLVAANVRNYISEDAKSVLVTGSLSDELLKKVADAVKAITGVQDIRVSGGLNRSADTAVMLSDVDAVVLVEKLKVTKQADLKEELAMIDNAGKVIVGVSV